MSSRKSLPLQIAPSILTADFGRLADEIAAAEAGGADMIHLDVMDGPFAPNITFGPTVVAAVRQVTTLPLDVHLMIEEPERFVQTFAQAGATSITVHFEATHHLHRTVQSIVDVGCRAGIALNPATPVEALREISPFVDLVLVMSVDPGYGGQQFIPTSTSKLRRVRKLLNEFNPTCDLEVDGGVGLENIGDVVRNGANVIVVGSGVYNKERPISENLKLLRQAAQNR